MHFFSIITGAVVLIHTGGVYRQTDLYARGSQVYAKVGAGFIRLGAGGSTSAPRTKWAQFDAGDTAIIIERSGAAPEYQGEREAVIVRAAE